MPLTREFKQTVVERLQKDSRFRQAMLAGAIQELLDGDIRVGKSTLRDYINATIGFSKLAKKLKKDSKSVQRMLGPNGNPRADNIFSIIRILSEEENYTLSIKINKRKAA